MNTSEEQRGYARVKSNFNVKINFGDAMEEIYTIKVGKSIDVSAKGILFDYEKPMKKGSIVSVAFLRPNSFEFFEGEAKVTRVEKNPDNKTYSIAIEFVNLSDDEAQKLDFYLSRRQ